MIRALAFSNGKGKISERESKKENEIAFSVGSYWDDPDIHGIAGLSDESVIGKLK